MPTSPLAQPRTTGGNTSGGAAPPRTSAPRARQQFSGVVSEDSGVDSPTYDGDIESSTTAGGGDRDHLGGVSSKGSSLAGSISHHPSSSTSTLTSPVSTTFSQAVHENEPERNTPVLQSVNVAAVPLTVPDEPAPVPVAMAEYDPARFTPEEVRDYVQKAISGEAPRSYKINSPPVGRPVRIYADGELLHRLSIQWPYSNLTNSQVYMIYFTLGALRYTTAEMLMHTAETKPAMPYNCVKLNYPSLRCTSLSESALMSWSNHTRHVRL